MFNTLKVLTQRANDNRKEEKSYHNELHQAIQEQSIRVIKL